MTSEDDLAARFRPSDANSVASPSKQRAQGMPGARCTRGLVCQKCALRRTRAYRAAETLRHPLRNGFTAYFVLSPVERACCHRRRRDTSRRLSASIAAPGPHDFAVRSRPDFAKRLRRATTIRLWRAASIASRAQRVVTMAIRPSGGHETALFIILFFRNEKRNIFSWGTGQPKSP